MRVTLSSFIIPRSSLLRKDFRMNQLRELARRVADELRRMEHRLVAHSVDAPLAHGAQTGEFFPDGLRVFGESAFGLLHHQVNDDVWVERDDGLLLQLPPARARGR